jgi:hypothetical protein
MIYELIENYFTTAQLLFVSQALSYSRPVGYIVLSNTHNNNGKIHLRSAIKRVRQVYTLRWSECELYV